MSLQTAPERDQEPPRTPAHPAAGRPTTWARLGALAIGVAAVLCVVATAFTWPAINAGPRDVPVAVAGSPPIVEQLRGALAAGAGEGALEVRVVPDRRAAEEAIADRKVYGAIVLGPEGGQLLTASAASPVVAELLTTLAGNVPPQVGGPLPVTDLVPLPPDDPRGAGLATAVLPLVIGGLIAGGLTAVTVRGRVAQLLSVGVLALAGGLVLAAVNHLWLGVLVGSYWLNAAVFALGVAAVATAVVGLVRLVGLAGIALTAAVMVLLGSPLSGVQTAPEMLPAGWATLGQLLPPGATGTALRSVAWFDGAGSGPALLVLACWVVAGALLLLLPARRGASGQ